MNAFFESVANNVMTNLIGMTLVHFLWQAILVAIAFGAMLKLQRKCTSQIRYLTSLAGLFVMIVCPLITFVALNRNSGLGEVEVSDVVAHAPGDSFENDGSTASLETTTGSFNDIDRVPVATERPSAEISAVPIELGFLNSARVKAILPWLVALWSVGVVVLAIRLMLGFNRIRSWRRLASSVSSPQLIKIHAQLCKRVGLKKPVLLLESIHANSPIVISWLRPTVLIPASIVSGLTLRQVEAILVHELAHIHRHDYLINLGQAIVETVLFYHPAVWWLSNRVRDEREHCCDDMAIEVCGDRKTFVHALARLEEIRCQDFQVVVAANSGSVVNRMKRILNRQPSRRHSVWPAGVVALVSVVCLIGTLLALGDGSAAFANSIQSETVALSPNVRTEPLVSPKADEAYVTEKGEIKKMDTKTGMEQSLLPGITLSSGDQKRASVKVDMKFTNLLSYSLIPARVAKELGAVELGQIDFGERDPKRKALENSLLNFKPAGSEESPTNFAELVNKAIHTRTVYVNEVSKFDDTVTITPYPNDPVWFPGHLGFYGMNQIRQHVFKVVRIEKVDLGIGPTFGPINALVLDDRNSDFGLLSRDWFQGPQGENGERLVFFAAETAFKFLLPLKRPNEAQGWGPAPDLGNLRLRLTLNESELKEGQPVLATLEIKNFGEAVESYDPQYFDRNRVVNVKHVSGEPGQFIASSVQTMGGPIPLPPGQSRVLWEDVDVGSLYMLDQGEYRIQAISPISKNVKNIPKTNVNRLQLARAMPISNVEALRVSTGEQTPIKRFLKSLISVAPAGWKVSYNSYGIFITNSPTGMKRDTTTISMSFTPEAIPEDQNVRNRLKLGMTELGHLNLSSNDKAARLWPNHIAEIRQASSSIK